MLRVSEPNRETARKVYVTNLETPVLLPLIAYLWRVPSPPMKRTALVPP